MKKCAMCDNEVKHFNAVTCSDECKIALKDKKLVERQIRRDKELKDELGEDEYNKLPECKICHIRSNDLIPHITHFHKISLNDYKLQHGDCVRSEKYMLELSERSKGDKNPVHKIEDKRILSPYSYVFYVNKGFDEETAKTMALEKAREVQAAKTDEQKTTKLEYWIKKTDGNVEEAKKLFKERQSTFSKEKCIEQHGESKGMDIWSKRQEKWQNTLNDKTDDEITEINRKKAWATDFNYLKDKYGENKAKEIIQSRFSSKSYSKISQMLFSDIYPHIKGRFWCKFATLKSDGNINDDGVNDEYFVYTKQGVYRLLDFYIPELKKCIEFDGDYYHSEKFYKGNKTRDAIREQEIKDTVEGIQILHINENEYRKNKEATIQKCLEFING